ncbi:response regulator [candidate division KSB1 bacterium]|nr:response regulator [candidate division KSB1 bacterium]
MNQEGGKAKILVVDDEEIIRIGCSRILEDQNMWVEEAANGRIGWEKIQASPDYDLVLLDLMMPEMGGLEVLDEIQRIDSKIVTIMITGFATIETAVDAMRKGAYDYLPKPFSPDELRAKINRGLEKRRLTMEAEQLREERDRNLLQLSKEKSRTLTLINCMSEGIIATNRAGQIVLINPAACNMMRLSCERALGATVKGLLENPDLEQHIAEMLETVQRTAIMTRKEFTTSDKRVLQSNTSPIVDDQGETLGTITALLDITEDKKIEQMKSDFIRLVSHELKAPIGAIEGYLNLIIEGLTAGDSKKEREIIIRSRDKAENLLLLINDLLDMSRAERKISKTMTPTDISAVLKETVEFYRNEAKSKSLSFGLELPEPLPPVLANQDDLGRLFSNLISNAIKYTPEKGSVQVSVRQAEGQLMVEITDTGIGLSEEDLQKIFGEFFRAKNAVQRKISGTGLGLSICKRIIEDHNGYIQVESKLDVGSRFRVILPVHKLNVN